MIILSWRRINIFVLNDRMFVSMCVGPFEFVVNFGTVKRYRPQYHQGIALNLNRFSKCQILFHRHWHHLNVYGHCYRFSWACEWSKLIEAADLMMSNAKPAYLGIFSVVWFSLKSSNILILLARGTTASRSQQCMPDKLIRHENHDQNLVFGFRKVLRIAVSAIYIHFTIFFSSSTLCSYDAFRWHTSIVLVAVNLLVNKYVTKQRTDERTNKRHQMEFIGEQIKRILLNGCNFSRFRLTFGWVAFEMRSHVFVFYFFVSSGHYGPNPSWKQRPNEARKLKKKKSCDPVHFTFDGIRLNRFVHALAIASLVELKNINIYFRRRKPFRDSLCTYVCTSYSIGSRVPAT